MKKVVHDEECCQTRNEPCGCPEIEVKYVISETATSTWHYHLRLVGPEGLKLSGGAPPALCGAKLGWDTQFPLSSWGIKDHMPSVWCKKCTELRRNHES